MKRTLNRQKLDIVIEIYCLLVGCIDFWNSWLLSPLWTCCRASAVFDHCVDYCKRWWSAVRFFPARKDKNWFLITSLLYSSKQFTSWGRAKVNDCWKGHEPELKTCMLKSTENNRECKWLVCFCAQSRHIKSVRQSTLTVKRFVWICKMSFELFVEIFAHTNILKHSLQFGCVFEAAGLFQFGDHACLGVIAGWHVLNEPFRKHFAVKFLEDILIFNILENNHLEIQKQR